MDLSQKIIAAILAFILMSVFLPVLEYKARRKRTRSRIRRGLLRI